MADPWWKSAVLYQIYPRSFADSSGDGVGDLPGISVRLPHLVELGVDALWLSPVYPSPMADFGYDVSDFVAIDPQFGTLSDFDALVHEAHARGLKVLIDLVANHTSERHPWFIESRSSRRNEKRDWYIWRAPGPGGGPPNNWLSEFGGPAWQFDATTGQFYYHAFLAAQPDLNWRNENVRAAMHAVMRFWLRRGVDGFRVDAIWHLLKDAQFRDDPQNPDYSPDDRPHRRVVARYSSDQPDVHEVIRGLRGVIDEFPERLLIGETYLPVERLVSYYGRELSGLHMPFNFGLLQTPWRAREIARLIDRYEAALPNGAWPNWVLGNHDRPRVASRVGPRQARIAAMLLLTLRGTPTLYYGDEIGMPQMAIAPECLQDPFEKNVPGLGFGRDGCRTPMQWDASPNAGFSCAPPWLPLADDYASHNVACQRGDAASLYNLYRRLIAVRRTHPAIAIGSYQPVETDGNILAFLREHGRERIFVALNFGDESATAALPPGEQGTVLVSAMAGRDGETVRGSVGMGGHDGLVLALL